ncbi:hypothetical protein V462_20210 [Pantoea ananatis 15320]|nr:hypothetical protein L585_03640 [Pantoea ananatis BRT175]PKC30697.1 hypothetical protein V462_20210 [Pantoea ananatis 15320]PKC41945.1 hypothetical protein V461_15705 [Pantoea ananatis BRT98]
MLKHVKKGRSAPFYHKVHIIKTFKIKAFHFSPL